MRIGPYELANPVMLAPMAGMSDWPFREICKAMGAGYAVGEMTASKPELRDTRKSRSRWAHEHETGFKVVQLLGADPHLMAEAARYAEAGGADVVDINMGCPAKKVLQAACGSALMRDEPLVGRILNAVVGAVSVPVTLKIRTGWSDAMKNAVSIARIAQNEGVAMLTVHGRTREQGFRGSAEYETIRAVKRAVAIPVIANGDIDGPEKARFVMSVTGADGVMIGRAAYGNPWIFRDVAAALGFREDPAAGRPPSLEERRDVLRRHIALHFDYYGDQRGAALFRKHLTHYFSGLPEAREAGLEELLRLDGASAVAEGVERLFETLTRTAARADT